MHLLSVIVFVDVPKTITSATKKKKSVIQVQSNSDSP